MVYMRKSIQYNCENMQIVTMMMAACAQVFKIVVESLLTL